MTVGVCSAIKCQDNCATGEVNVGGVEHYDLNDLPGFGLACTNDTKINCNKGIICNDIFNLVAQALDLCKVLVATEESAERQNVLTSKFTKS